jgi:hypothetical protein
MPYTAGPFIDPHMYVQWGGKLPGGEQWSCGLRMGQVAPGTWLAGDAATDLAAISTAISAFHARAGSKIDSRALLSFCKVNFIGTDGKYVLPTTNEHIFADIPGGITSGYTPNQITLAATMLTAFSRGPAHEGRFFIPLPAMFVTSSGLIDAADGAAVKASCATLLTALNAVDSKYKVMVFSRKAGAAAKNAVTGFKIGLVLDTQRRRRKSLPESYV